MNSCNNLRWMENSKNQGEKNGPKGISSILNPWNCTGDMWLCEYKSDRPHFGYYLQVKLISSTAYVNKQKTIGIYMVKAQGNNVYFQVKENTIPHNYEIKLVNKKFELEAP